ncbi:hypothetical protein CDL12_08405 [Handroanthus impetiginosus]|uniref:Uncharacterized protein n=1 Tax=Handroanthus impetiginosus TaxID=429701 RepID=A0A2G9HN11_9LAMI|nr:hypothetical protein CDL12_08405 [Handroanthus impetiginosus]
MNLSHELDIDTPDELPPICRKFQKVPPHIRREDCSSGAYDPSGAYYPTMVSFGPYHHGQRKLQICEEVKHLALEMFVQGSNHNQEFFQAAVLREISEARDCYFDDSMEEYTDEQLARMMLLDSCFLIYIIYITVSPQSSQEHHLGNYLPVFLRLGCLDRSLIFQDAFLMENQIPFKILMLLISLRYDDGGDMVSKFLKKVAWDKSDEPKHEHIKKRLENSPPLHLLGALHAVLVWDETPKNLQEQIQNYIGQSGGDMRKPPKAYRSAKDLKEKGIYFRCSSGGSLKAIKFSSFFFFGKLELQPAYVSSLSRVVFLNLIAYELCPNNVLDYTVVCYVDFMKSLIVSPADVKELREKKVLLTSWTDEDVVRLYKDLDTFDILAADKYNEVKQQIQKHYDSKIKTSMVQLYYNYFSSPWTTIAWFAGVFIFILTAAQTYFTVHPKSG